MTINTKLHIVRQLRKTGMDEQKIADSISLFENFEVAMRIRLKRPEYEFNIKDYMKLFKIFKKEEDFRIKISN